MSLDMMCDPSVIGRAARAAHREEFKEPAAGDVRAGLDGLRSVLLGSLRRQQSPVFLI